MFRCYNTVRGIPTDVFGRSMPAAGYAKGEGSYEAPSMP